MNAVADAKTIYRKEVEWMARQPKARSTKSRARVNAFYELTERTKALPQADVRPDFGNVGMVRQGEWLAFFAFFLAFLPFCIFYFFV